MLCKWKKSMKHGKPFPSPGLMSSYVVGDQTHIQAQHKVIFQKDKEKIRKIEVGKSSCVFI